jgi:hypothetical protein
MAKRRSTSLAQSALHAAANAASQLFCWAKTDHSGMSKALDRMPSSSLLESLNHIVGHFLITVVGAVLTGLWVYVLIGYVLPYLIFGKL